MVCQYKLDDRNVYRYSMPVIQSNMYMILSGNEALIIDPHVSEEAFRMLEDQRIQRVTMILTHEHYDHISGVNAVRELISDCTVYGSDACKQMVPIPDKNLSAYFMAIFIGRSDNEVRQAQELFGGQYSCEVDTGFTGNYELAWQGIHLELIETPGHSPGSICIVVKSDQKTYLFSGDSLVQGAKIITRIPGGDKAAYNNFTRPFLTAFPAGTVVFPGHGMESLIETLEIV